MMLPDDAVPAPDVTCGECWRLYGARGTVVAVIAQDGRELYLRCSCGAIVERDQARQQDLFGGAAA